jgi:hypothetical protein
MTVCSLVSAALRPGFKAGPPRVGGPVNMDDAHRGRAAFDQVVPQSQRQTVSQCGAALILACKIFKSIADAAVAGSSLKTSTARASNCDFEAMI